MELKDICIPIQREVESVEEFISSHLESRVPFVESVLEYVIRNGGKRLRPILTILSAKLSGYRGQASIPIGAAIEFMHSATLLHDDVIDNATLRRGRTSINRKWGNHVSVLVGDFLYCRAMDILVQQGDTGILRVITDAITRTTEGEILEITKSNDLSISKEGYLEIIIGKTASLMAAACQAGARLGQVSEDFEEALRRFGLKIGIAFQLMDDVLDYTATEGEFGKKSGTDFREGKLTLPLIIVIAQCSEEELQVIKNDLLSDVFEESRFKDILKIVERYDGIRETVRLARGYVQEAKDMLSPFRHSLEKETLLAVADHVVLRRS